MRNFIISLKKNITKYFNLKNLIIHPFLIAIYPILDLFARTGFELEPQLPLRSIVFVLSLTVILLLLLYWFLRDWDRTGILSTIGIVFFYYFGSAFRGLQGKFFIGYKIFQPLTVFILWALLFVTLAIFIKRSKLHQKKIFTLWLNLVTIILIAQPVFYTVLILKINYQDPLHYWEANNIPQNRINLRADLPDIYYIIVDGYGREDTLSDIFNYSNHEFTMALSDRGFYVADQANSNYVQTALSITSSLNLDYLSELQESGENSKSRTILKKLISDSQIRKILNLYNYKFIAFNTGHNLTKIEEADIYYDNFLGFNSFEEILLSNTILFLLDDYSNNKFPFFSYKTHRSRIRFTLDRIQDIPSIQGPTFTIAHIMIPHPPFVFDKNGNPVSPDGPFNMHDANDFPGSESNYKSGYINQLQYANDQLLVLIDTILDESESPPIIVLQGDHGSRMLLDWGSINESCFREASSILNAYYLPGIDSSKLYPSISPVNSFRIILNEYFSQHFPVLEDKTYFSNFSQPYNFIDVTEKLSEDCGFIGYDPDRLEVP